jgi:hypothetical protein
VKADTKDLIKFLVGLTWNGVIVWFIRYRVATNVDGLVLAILFTSGAFGWMPLARSAYPKAPVLWSLATFLVASITIGSCAMVISLVREQGILMSLLGVIMYVTVPFLLIGIGWLVWKGIRTIKR